MKQAEHTIRRQLTASEYAKKRRTTIEEIASSKEMDITERSPKGREERIMIVLRYYNQYTTIAALSNMTGDTEKQIRDTIAYMLEDEIVEYITVKCDCTRIHLRAFRIAGNF